MSVSMVMALLLFCGCAPTTIVAFSVSRTHHPKPGVSSSASSVVLGAADDESSDSNTASGIQKPPLTSQEIAAQVRAKKPNAAHADDKYPQLFNDNLLLDMKEALSLLEQRIQKGAGALSEHDVDVFTVMTQNILIEMQHTEYERLQDAATAETTPVSETSSAAVPPPPPPPLPPPSPSSPAPSSSASTLEARSLETAQDPLVEGPDYDPAGGQGSLPRDTANTYIIPDMEEMSPEEYRAALQKTITERQTRRKVGGNYGNRQTLDYLNNLSSNPLEKGGLKTKKTEQILPEQLASNQEAYTRMSPDEYRAAFQDTMRTRQTTDPTTTTSTDDDDDENELHL